MVNNLTNDSEVEGWPDNYQYCLCIVSPVFHSTFYGVKTVEELSYYLQNKQM